MDQRQREWVHRREGGGRDRSLDMREGDNDGGYKSGGVHQGDQGTHKAGEVKREHAYLADWAQQKLEETTAAAVQATDESNIRAMEAQRAAEGQQTAAP